MQQRHHKRGRWLGVCGAAVALSVTGCAIVPPDQVGVSTPPAVAPTAASPTTPVVPSPPSPPPEQATPTPLAPTSSPPSVPPSPTKSTKPTADPARRVASGSLVLYQQNLVSDQLTGTCTRQPSRFVLELQDRRNDFFDGVAIKVTATEAAAAGTEVEIRLGEDSESISHTLTAGPRASGTSASFTRSGDSVRITGKARMTDNGKVSATAVPFTIIAKCK